MRARVKRKKVLLHYFRIFHHQLCPQSFSFNECDLSSLAPSREKIHTLTSSATSAPKRSSAETSRNSRSSQGSVKSVYTQFLAQDLVSSLFMASITLISVVHRSMSRINCDIKLEHFTVSYTERQHKIIQSIVQEMERNNRSWKHRHKRPRCSIRKDPRYKNFVSLK